MLQELFSFQHGKDFAIGFTQIDFWFFFLIVMLIFSTLHKSTLMKTIFITAISLFFYFKTSGASVLILSGSIILNYFSGKFFFSVNSKLKKKVIMISAVSINVLILAYFKYAYFFTESFNEIFQTKYQALNYFAQWTSGFSGQGSLRVCAKDHRRQSNAGSTRRYDRGGNTRFAGRRRGRRPRPPQRGRRSSG